MNNFFCLLYIRKILIDKNIMINFLKILLFNYYKNDIIKENKSKTIIFDNEHF